MSVSEGLSAEERQGVLAGLVENGVMSAERIEGYLDWFVRFSENNPKRKNAIEKWEEDRRFIRDYIPGNHKIRVRDIFVK